MAGETQISDLIKDIERGDLILPEFQRGYIWTKDQVRSFLQSLYRNYPTGSFLIWKTPTPPKTRGDSLPNEALSYRLILDGQQRLTSIYALIHGEPPPFYEGEKLFFDLYFNLVKEEFAYFKKTVMTNNPEWIQVTGFFKKGFASFMQEVNDLEPSERQVYIANMGKLTQLAKIPDYLYYLKELTELDMDRVVEVFNLVNSAGTILSKSDLALAHICSKWPEARERFWEAKRSYAALGFDFDLSFYTRLTSIVATGSALYDPLYRAPIEDVKDAWPKVTRALDFVFNVLKGDAFIDDGDSFPSMYVVMPLVAFFATTGKAHFDSEAQKRSFLHWMYAALMWGRYSGSTETKLQADIEALKAPDPPARLRENIVAERGRIKVEAADIEGAGIRSPFYPMSYIVARSRGAIDWFNGTALYQKQIGRSFGLEAHHIFPQAVLRKAGYEPAKPLDKKMINEMANLAFLTKQANLKISASRPEAYLPNVLAKHPDALNQQAVPGNPTLWSVDRYPQFLGERRKLLAKGINEFMDSLLAHDRREEWTISDFIAAGEGPRVEFKSSIRWDRQKGEVNRVLEHSVARTIAGFMNHDGGTLVVGVADDGAVMGLDDDIRSLTRKPTQDGLALHFTEILTKYLGASDAPMVGMSFASVDGKLVVVLGADPAMSPVFVDNEGALEFWVRSGSSTRQLNMKDATEYINAHWNGHASRQMS
jgi:hypothetical protein